MAHFDFPPPYGTEVRPARLTSNRATWAKDPSSPTANDGTRLDASTMNTVIAALRTLITASGVNPAEGDDSALVAAVEAFVATETAAAIAALIDSSPATLDTLNELAAALGDDGNFAATMTTALAGKQPLDALLTALAAIPSTWATDKGLYFPTETTVGTFDMSPLARTLQACVTAAAMRASSVLNIESVTAIGDTDATIAATTRVAWTSAALTAPRAWTLPAANAVNDGQMLIIMDGGGVSPTNKIVLTRAGSDSINGFTTFDFDVAGGMVLLWSNGGNYWKAHLIPLYGISAGQAVRLDSSARLPAVDGSLLTNVVAGASLLAPGTMMNGKIVASVAGNALTLALKTLAGTDPQASDKVTIVFSDGTKREITAATSIVVSSGSTLGTLNSIPFRVWVTMFDDAGTLRMGVRQCYDHTNHFIAGFNSSGIASSTAEGGAGAADSFGVNYTGTAVTDKQFVPLASAEWDSGLATAGTWSAGPTRVVLAGANGKLPGAVVKDAYALTTAVSSSAATTPTDDTIPQSGEGAEILTRAITPTAAMNMLEIETHVQVAASAADNVVLHLHQDAVANALAASMITTGGANNRELMMLRHRMLAAAASSTTFKTRVGGAGATITINGSAGARLMGGVSGNTFLKITERMT